MTNPEDINKRWLASELIELVADAKEAFNERGEYEVSALGQRLNALKLIGEMYGHLSHQDLSAWAEDAEDADIADIRDLLSLVREDEVGSGNVS